MRRSSVHHVFLVLRFHCGVKFKTKLISVLFPNHMERWQVGILFTLMWHSTLFSPSVPMFCFGPISSYYSNIKSKPMKNNNNYAWISCVNLILVHFYQEVLRCCRNWEVVYFPTVEWLMVLSDWNTLCCKEYSFPFKWCRTVVEWGNIYFASNASVKRNDKTRGDVLCLLILMVQECVHFFHCIWVIFK